VISLVFPYFYFPCCTSREVAGIADQWGLLLPWCPPSLTTPKSFISFSTTIPPWYRRFVVCTVALWPVRGCPASFSPHPPAKPFSCPSPVSLPLDIFLDLVDLGKVALFLCASGGVSADSFCIPSCRFSRSSPSCYLIQIPPSRDRFLPTPVGN